MSAKLKSLVALGSTIRARPRIRAALPSVSLLGAQSPAPPSGASCSRWLTCSCCRLDIPRGTFFSANSASTRATSRLDPIDLEDAVPEHLSALKSKTPHLPLPPPLPYSPNSHPFRRHLEILSLSLYSSPDESWQVYSALHPSLRRYIPDETFRSLLSHQLKHSESRLAWHRAKMLLRLAKQCDVALESLSFELLAGVTGIGLRSMLGAKGGKADDKDYRLVRRLWTALSGMVDSLGSIPLDIRRDWLKTQLRRVHKRDVAGPRSWAHKGDLSPVEMAVVDLVERGGGAHLGRTIGQVLFHARGGSTHDLLVTLRLIAWASNKGVVVPFTGFIGVMRKLTRAWSRAGQDGIAILKEEIARISLELEPSSTSSMTQSLHDALAFTVQRSQSRTQKVLALLSANELGLPGLIRHGMALAQSASRERDTRSALETSIRLFESAARDRDSDCNAIIAAITHALYTARSRKDTGIDDLAISFARSVYEAQLAHKLPSETIIPLLRLIITIRPSQDAYILTRKLYQYARAAEPPFRWSQHNIDHWRRLFHCSISPPNLHLHFASRLYADFMADGLAVRRPDALAMIRAVGMSSSPSRPILLERHIKDYLWANYGRKPAFIAAVVQGLSKNRISDASLALSLAQRLAESDELQPVVVQLIIGQLARSSKPQHRVRCFQLLRSLKPSPTASWCYNTVLSFLVASARRRPGDVGQLSYAEALNYAVALYKEMISSNIRTNARTISTMIRVMLDNGHLQPALGVFHACIDRGIRLKSSAVGRIMVRLAIDGRLDEVDHIEQRWRSIADGSHGRGWDKGVVGARVLADIKRGKEVDLAQVASRSGWKGTESFLAFLETLKPPRDNGDVLSKDAAVDQMGRAKPFWFRQEGTDWQSDRARRTDLFAGSNMGIVAF